MKDDLYNDVHQKISAHCCQIVFPRKVVHKTCRNKNCREYENFRQLPDYINDSENNLKYFLRTFIFTPQNNKEERILNKE